MEENRSQGDPLPAEALEYTVINKLAELPLSARIPSRRIFEDDWRVRPTKAHPHPVILIHGTGVTKGDWMELGADLRTAGYAVFAPDFGLRATAPVVESANQISAYIHAVLTVTGAEKVVLVGHSQGGVLARYWMQLLGGGDKTHQLICLSTPNHGTTSGGVAASLLRTQRAQALMGNMIQGFFGPAGPDMLEESSVIAQLNEHGETLPGVYYTCIATHADSLISPVESCFLEGEGVRNMFIQDIDRRALVLHEDMPRDKRVRALVLEEIDRVNPGLPPIDSSQTTDEE
ncbi:triacylglycerol lipase [Corynebacterium sp. 153RC1]|uniref:esterase/lipase family protein n=1 Tax=unclassified Corynebacterium TaxID=2624378 RepID=UPI00211B8BF8|nr:MULTISPECIES: triacylglycerol lipase [unclassified Corynebacterium]MCQ9352818.1 triacylglycerol lipase [Corynebacterium sp. 209RC1]MCQ9355210.1 triacylglycerol lipase [Corynebacterium sp. 1222RC1]MCQ9357397.1 triacylglycerol lipase [Corynebacterium sp. 122RC1]MCQ9359676.1 triacylglycerol lipase [Corynebacterium sp. 142RC1]MCQ9361689.1 triacylglycerol lipase [Corynebacterium sp. 153RC1]